MSLPFSSKRTLKDDVCAISSAAKIPAGPPPTMMTSYCFVILSPTAIVYPARTSYKEETIE
jgi:hypothetical protein